MSYSIAVNKKKPIEKESNDDDWIEVWGKKVKIKDLKK